MSNNFTFFNVDNLDVVWWDCVLQLHLQCAKLLQQTAQGYAIKSKDFVKHHVSKIYMTEYNNLSFIWIN